MDNKLVISRDELEDRADFFSKHVLGQEYFGYIHYVEKENKYGHETVFDGMFNYTGEAYEEDWECTIEINERLATDVLHLNDVLLHELIHYKLWYLGYDCADGDRHFEDELKKYRVSSTDGYTYRNNKKKYSRNINEYFMKKYESMYQEYKTSKLKEREEK